MSGAVAGGPGSRFAFDGAVVEVTGFEGTRVTLRDARDRWRTLGLAGYRRRGLIDEQLIPAVLAAAGEPSPVTEVERRVSGAHPALVRPVVMHLLWSGALATDMGRSLGGDSMIWPRAGAAA